MGRQPAGQEKTPTFSPCQAKLGRSPSPGTFADSGPSPRDLEQSEAPPLISRSSESLTANSQATVSSAKVYVTY